MKCSTELIMSLDFHLHGMAGILTSFFTRFRMHLTVKFFRCDYGVVLCRRLFLSLEDAY